VVLGLQIGIRERERGDRLPGGAMEFMEESQHLRVRGVHIVEYVQGQVLLFKLPKPKDVFRGIHLIY
jgi:hypothetical protein